MNANRVGRIRSCLQQAFTPQKLDVIDESHLHVGHAGAHSGKGHFRVEIVSAAFAGQLPLARHRAVYAALGNLMDQEIHALAITARTPTEAG